MAEAYLNFVDHCDGTFSCRPHFSHDGEYNANSRAHRICGLLCDFVHLSREQAPDGYVMPSGIILPEDTDLPELPTKAHMVFRDEGEAFRANVSYMPADVAAPTSQAHKACRLAHAYLHELCQAKSDALVKRVGSRDIQVVKKAVINAEHGHGE